MTCFCFASDAAGSGTGMPHVKLDREIDRSFRPPRTKLSTSFLRALRRNRERVALDQLDQLFLKRAQLEKEVFFRNGFEDAAAVRAGRARGRIDEGLIAHAI